jgi:hypothetical protein
MGRGTFWAILSQSHLVTLYVEGVQCCFFLLQLFT